MTDSKPDSGAINYSLAQIKGVLDRSSLHHLLRRCIFGVGHAELKQFEGKDINWCLDTLLTPAPRPESPITEDSFVAIDPLVPVGQKWEDAPFEADIIDMRRGVFLRMWWMGNLLNRSFSLTETMTLFWHTHFVTEIDMVEDSRYSYRYVSLLRDNALGNFRSLIKAGTRDTAMLVYLGGNQNTKTAPNENYARELMELFVLGKDPRVKYTEDDVRAAARIFTGYKDDKNTIKATFDPTLHDTSDKQFSAYFDHQVIKGKTGPDGAHEADEFVDMLFSQRDAARFLCRNIYRWFVCGTIDDQVEQHIIEPLSQILIRSNFEVRPVLRQLLGSEHFFDAAYRGSIVKSPVDFLVGAVHQFNVPELNDLRTDHFAWGRFYEALFYNGMGPCSPPSVAGWPAYYLSPKYNQWWIGSIGGRFKLMKELCSPKGKDFGKSHIRFDFPGLVSGFEHPGDPDKLIQDCLDFMLPVEVDGAVKKQLRSILLSGQTNERHWETAWNEFTLAPDNKQYRDTIDNRLRPFFEKIFSLPEYQIM